MLLTPHQLSDAAASYICPRHGDITAAYIYGGPVAIDATVAEGLAATIRGDNCP